MYKISKFGIQNIPDPETELKKSWFRFRIFSLLTLY
jgi:hypothetical protein